MVSVNVALCSGQFAMSVLQTFFMFYYVKVYLNIFKIDEFWFAITQGLFIVWNALNDPIFGYAQDTSSTWFHCRTKVISFFGPFLAASFLLLWFPWGSANQSFSYIIGLQLLIGLFMYDAFYSCINVAWSALFAEATFSRFERISAVKYSQFAVLLSVNIVPLTEKITGGLNDFFAFQCISIAVAVLAVVCFKVTGSLKHQKKGTKHDDFFSLVVPSRGKFQQNGTKHDDFFSLVVPSRGKFQQNVLYALKLMKQVLTRRDFRIIAGTYFLHACSQTIKIHKGALSGTVNLIILPDIVVNLSLLTRFKRNDFRSTAHLNFAAITIKLLIPEQVMMKGSWRMSLFYAACTLLPQVCHNFDYYDSNFSSDFLH
ncbi:unnamed protein product [Gongylonema pulchrum]|uniref:Major facilitator superfamily protein n=1 Tax=Gongylonema pulchrum TaxID=637853 RepID=A0A183DZT3_9BILA|nr:unnamed protein product [Gongylonema pulchrum]